MIHCITEISTGLQDVPVNVVGKYRYYMASPRELVRVPIIVDIILVGRTKIITLHSCVWLENKTDVSMSFRLLIPTTPLVAPLKQEGLQGERPQEGVLDSNTLWIGPLARDAGAFWSNTLWSAFDPSIVFRPVPASLL